MVLECKSPDNWFLGDRLKEPFPQNTAVIVDIKDLLFPNIDNVFIQIEPDAINDIDTYLINNYTKYKYIYTYSAPVLSTCPNARFYLFGSARVPHTVYMNIDCSKKKFAISTICGSKQCGTAKGHILRQLLYYNQKYFDSLPITFFRSSNQHPHLPDFGNNPFVPMTNIPENNDKGVLFDRYQYSIIIENSQQDNYFSEKLVDCLLSKTIPIYWGCPNIGAFFDTTGWILLDKDRLDFTQQENQYHIIHEIKTKISELTPNHYEKYYHTIHKNWEQAQLFIDPYKNIIAASIT